MCDFSRAGARARVCHARTRVCGFKTDPEIIGRRERRNTEVGLPVIKFGHKTAVQGAENE